MQRLDAGDEPLDERVRRPLTDGTAIEIAMQRCAAEPYPAPMKLSATMSRSASGMTIMWFLPPPKAITRFPLRHALVVDVLGDLRRADEADGGNPSVPKDRVDCFLVTVDDVPDAVGKPGLLPELAEVEGRGRDTLGRLEDHSVADGDGHRGHHHAAPSPGS